MKRKSYSKSFFAYVLAMSVLLAGCGTTSSGNKATDEKTNGESNVAEEEGGSRTDEGTGATVEQMADFTAEEQFTERDLSGEYDESKAETLIFSEDGVEVSSKAVSVDGTTATIRSEGVYILSGTCSDGMVIVDTDKSEKVQIVLKGVTLRSQTSAAIYVKQADKVFLTLAEGTKNILESGSEYVAIDENNIDAAIFSKDDLTLNGTGSLEVSSQAGHGIVGKDDLVFADGTYTVTALKDTVSGKDSVRIAGGTFDLNAGDDGIKSENDEGSGYLYVCGGNFQMQATDKGMQAGSTVYVENGEFHLNAEDDAVHSNGFLYVGGGEFDIKTGDDAFHADNTLTVEGGKISITSCYEGLEAQVVNITGGEINLVSSDDGINAAGGNDGSSKSGGSGKGDMFDTDEDANITISGGVIRVWAEGDGLDSNGYITISGGEIYVTGPSNAGNGSLDYGIEAVIEGGLVVAAGASGMAENFGDSSTQGSMLVNTGRQEAGSSIALMDAAGTELVNWVSDKTYECVLISLPEIKEGNTYTLHAGDFSQDITMNTLIYGEGSGMGFGGGKGGHGRMDRNNADQNPMGGEGQTPPEMPDGNQPGGDISVDPGTPGEFPEGESEMDPGANRKDRGGRMKKGKPGQNQTEDGQVQQEEGTDQQKDDNVL